MRAFSLTRRLRFLTPSVHFTLLLGLLLFLAFGAAAPFSLRVGTALGVGGLFTMLRKAPGVALPQRWWILGLVFATLSLSWLLPQALFPVPDWRMQLAELGVDLGPTMGVQPRQAAFELAALIGMGLLGFSILGCRVSRTRLSHIVILFLLGASVYALLAFVWKGELTVNVNEDHFGFYPNRNHTSTFLSMGLVCAVGLFFQKLREDCFGMAGLSAAVGGLLAWALWQWSFSRAGVILPLVALVLWFFGVGWRYFQPRERIILGLCSLLALGSFALSGARVKSRLQDLTGKVSELQIPAEPQNEVERLLLTEEHLPETEPPPTIGNQIDFRVPIYRDTLGMIADNPLTGVGSGQFSYVFPQYREHTRAAYDFAVLHPESSWLWIATEHGIPALLVLVALTILIFRSAFRDISRRRNGDSRALRMSCLCAAFVVPLHALFDVPAQRPSLFLLACLLIALSQHRPSSISKRDDLQAVVPQKGKVGEKVSSLPPLTALLIGALFIASSTFSPVVPRDQFDQTYQQLKTPLEEFTADFDFFAEDPKALQAVDTLLKTLPLEPAAYGRAAEIVLPLEDRQEDLLRWLAIERFLIPDTPEVPLMQADLLSSSHPELVPDLWQKTLERAETIEELDARKKGIRKHMRKLIHEMAYHSEHLRDRDQSLP